MSKTLKSFPLSLLLLTFSIMVEASERHTSVVLSPIRDTGRVELTISELPNDFPEILTFPADVASVSFDKDRVIAVEGLSSNGTWISARRLSPFVFSIDRGYTSLRVSLNVGTRSDSFEKPFVSWLEGESGVFILGDLLPFELTGILRARFAGDDRLLEFPTVGSAVLTRFPDDDPAIRRDGVAIRRLGDWPLDRETAFSAVKEILDYYSRSFGSPSNWNTDIVMIRVADLPGKWTARTVGSTVIVASSGMPFASQEIQRFHEQMRHELFHLWIPNSLGLTGDYATFYEGFALYQSLKTGVSMGRIRFDDFLSTLGSAVRIAERMDARMQSSEWADDRESLYAAGMVSAFMTDVQLISSSRGRLSSDNFLKEFMRVNRDVRVPAATALSEHFDRYDALKRIGIGRDMMLRRESIDRSLRVSGLMRQAGGIVVVSNPDSNQRRVLRLLGYNVRVPVNRVQVR
jgi:hypothetical protein